MKQPDLQISLLGGVTILRGGTAVSGFVSRKVEALFIYLACNPRPHQRDTLAALLWPDNDQNRALANLSVALTSLRKSLDAYILTERHTVAFAPDADFGLDTAVFQQAIRQQVNEGQKKRGKLNRVRVAQLVTAVSLYKGDFLAGFNIRKAPEFEAWTLLEQERLRQMYLTALADLIIHYQEQGQFGEAIQYAQKLLAIDPLQEEIQRQLMALFTLNNQKTAALAQYEQFVQILDAELGVEPDEETTALYQQIVAGGWGAEEQRSRGENDNSAHLPTSSSPYPLIPSSPRHNLPTATTTFIGREAELAQIEEWLLDVNGRLLTITGPGGMGKTRLAQEAARAQIGTFADGVWAISLVAYNQFAEVVTAVAETIDFASSGKENPAQQLVKHLKNREMLLVLDNLEHLLSSELLGWITQLITNAPDIRLIVTSRERLRLQAETTLDLQGLPFPEASFQSSVFSESAPTPNPQSPIPSFPAIQLFTNRAQRVQADFKVDRQETAVVVLCQLVGGLPLALELAATWTRVLTVSEIVTEIQRGLETLTTNLHDIPDRHRSLHTVIATSWQMLSPDEQMLFRKLAVFRGGFTRTAAQVVAATTMTQLMTLADRSFLRLDADHRFRRHPLLLQFAQEQLAAQPEEKAQAEAAHAHFFADFAQARETALQGAEAPAARVELSVELENLRAAWQWGLEGLDTAVLSTILPSLFRFYGDRSRYLEGIDLLQNSLAALQAQPANVEREQLIAKLQAELGYFLHQNGRFADSETAYHAALDLAVKHDLTKTRIACLRGLGINANSQGHWQIARESLEAAYQLCAAENINDPDLKLPILNALGTLLTNLAEFDQARAYFAEAMALAKELGHSLRVAILYSNMGIIANREKNYEEAIRQWRLAEQGFAESGNDKGMANVIFNISMAQQGLEQFEEALQNMDRASALFAKLGQKDGLAAGLGVQGMIYHKMGKRAAARRSLHECVLLSHELGMAGIAISGLTELAELEISGGNFEQAARLLYFIRNHPATSGTTRQNVENLLQELTAELPPELMRKAETAVQTHTLESLIGELVGGA